MKCLAFFCMNLYVFMFIGMYSYECMHIQFGKIENVSRNFTNLSQGFGSTKQFNSIIY